MFDHIEIVHKGEYICVNCGVVLGQEYVCFSDYAKLVNIVKES